MKHSGISSAVKPQKDFLGYFCCLGHLFSFVYTIQAFIEKKNRQNISLWVSSLRTLPVTFRMSDNASKCRHKCTHIPALWLFIKTYWSYKYLVCLPVLKYKHINYLIFICCSSPQGCLQVVLSRQVEVDGLSSLTQEALEETCISSHISITANQLIAQYHSLLLNVQVMLRLVQTCLSSILKSH